MRITEVLIVADRSFFTEIVDLPPSVSTIGAEETHLESESETISTVGAEESSSDDEFWDAEGVHRAGFLTQSEIDCTNEKTLKKAPKMLGLRVL